MKKNQFTQVEGTDHLDQWIQVIKSRIAQEYDEMILIEGYEGSGKSTGAYVLGKALDSGFSHERMALNGEELVTIFPDLSPGDFLVWDEAVLGGFSRDAMTKQNKTIQQMFILSRARCIINIVVIPNINWVDNITREHRARWLISFPYRGVGVWKTPYTKPDGTRGWTPLFAARLPKPVDDPDYETYYKRKHGQIEHFLDSMEI
jgi:hypothetical protein